MSMVYEVTVLGSCLFYRLLALDYLPILVYTFAPRTATSVPFTPRYQMFILIDHDRFLQDF